MRAADKDFYTADFSRLVERWPCCNCRMWHNYQNSAINCYKYCYGC